MYVCTGENESGSEGEDSGTRADNYVICKFLCLCISDFHTYFITLADDSDEGPSLPELDLGGVNAIESHPSGPTHDDNQTSNVEVDELHSSGLPTDTGRHNDDSDDVEPDTRESLISVGCM